MRVGIVGCGHIGRVHMSYLLHTPHVEIVAVSDQDGDRAKQAANEFRVGRHYDTLDDLLREESPDVVHISTPPSTHAALALRALSAGCHVFVEKPFALTLDEADRVIAAAKRARRQVCVDHNHLYDPPILQATNILESGALGEILSLNCFQGVSLPQGADPNSVRAWFKDLPLGPIQDVAPHSMAFLVRFIGTPATAHAVVRKRDSICSDVAFLAEGAGGSATCTLSLRARPFMHKLELQGTKASLEIDVERMMLKLKKDRNLPFVLRKAAPPLEESAHLAFSTVSNTIRYMTGRLKRFPGIGELIRRFYGNLEQGVESPVSMEEAREVVRLTDIMVEASRLKELCASS